MIKSPVKSVHNAFVTKFLMRWRKSKPFTYGNVAERLAGVELKGEWEESIGRGAGRLRDREFERARALCVRVHQRHTPDQLRVLRVQPVVPVARAHNWRASRRRSACVRRTVCVQCNQDYLCKLYNMYANTRIYDWSGCNLQVNLLGIGTLSNCLTL